MLRGLATPRPVEIVPAVQPLALFKTFTKNRPFEYLKKMALRVIEWVKYGKKFCSYRVHPPLKKGV